LLAIRQLKPVAYCDDSVAVGPGETTFTAQIQLAFSAEPKSAHGAMTAMQMNKRCMLPLMLFGSLDALRSEAAGKTAAWVFT
jgi:hypothetical protein